MDKYLLVFFYRSGMELLLDDLQLRDFFDYKIKEVAFEVGQKQCMLSVIAIESGATPEDWQPNIATLARLSTVTIRLREDDFPIEFNRGSNKNNAFIKSVVSTVTSCDGWKYVTAAEVPATLPPTKDAIIKELLAAIPDSKLHPAYNRAQFALSQKEHMIWYDCETSTMSEGFEYDRQPEAVQRFIKEEVAKNKSTLFVVSTPQNRENIKLTFAKTKRFG